MECFSEVTKIKIKILEEGVKFEPLSLFSDIIKEINFKNKTIYKKPISDGKEVYDYSSRNEIIPSEILLSDNKNESIVKCRYNPKSSIELRWKNGKLEIYQNNNKSKLNVNFIKEYDILQQKIDDEFLVGDYVDVVGMDRISLLLFEGCYNWICGKQCKFCDLHPKKVSDKVCKPTLNNLYKYNNVDEWWNSQKDLFFQNTNLALDKLLKNTMLKHKHLFIMAGNLIDSKTVWKFLIEFVENLTRQFDLQDFDTITNVCPHDSIVSLKKLKKLGIKQVQYNLEIANKDLFTSTCPGKINYEEFVSKLYEAVNIFGKGNVRSNFVLGLQDYNELINECEKFAKKGIVTDYSVFQPKKNTPYSNLEAPEMKDVINFTKRLVKIYVKYNQHPIFCSLSSRSSIVNEVYYDNVK